MHLGLQKLRRAVRCVVRVELATEVSFVEGAADLCSGVLEAMKTELLEPESKWWRLGPASWERKSRMTSSGLARGTETKKQEKITARWHKAFT